MIFYQVLQHVFRILYLLLGIGLLYQYEGPVEGDEPERLVGVVAVLDL